MPFVYILKSLKDGNLYTGSTNDLRRRVDEHNAGRTPSTKFRRPLRLVYFEEYDTIGEARVREKELKRPAHGKHKKKMICDFPAHKLKKYK